MIITENLSKRYDDFLAVDGVNLRVGAGEVLALLGPNGAGKTTTVRMLTSILVPTRGRAWVAGYDVVEQAAQVRASVGVLTENHGLYNRMRAAEYLDFFGELYRLDPALRRRRTGQLLEEFSLTEAAQRRLGEYSKGMRQKLALARALLHQPPVLLLDEPTSAMDPESARQVRDSVRELRSKERTIVICTHNLAEAEELADSIAIIRKGRLVAQGTAQNLKDQFLGHPEYEVHSIGPLDGRTFDLPAGARLTRRGEDWLRFASVDGRGANPGVLSRLLAQGLAVASLQEVPRSLEQVYLMAMEAARAVESDRV